MNDKYDTEWRKGWESKDRQYYSTRLTIIKYVYEQAKRKGGFGEAMA